MRFVWKDHVETGAVGVQGLLRIELFLSVRLAEFCQCLFGRCQTSLGTAVVVKEGL